jgi:transmembrane sensor
MSETGLKPRNEAMQAAAEWLVRVQNDELGAEQIAAWQRWLTASDRNRAAFERMQALWHGMERLPDKTPPALPARTSRFTFTPTLAATLATVLVTGGLASGYLWQSLRDKAPANTAVFETATGEHREVMLPDGSRLTLGARSLAWIRFDTGRRHVTLDRGEAYFAVAPQSGRPFVVHTATATVTAIGTAFNVRKSGERLLVAVTEGRVQVASTPGTPRTRMPTPPTELAAGHQLTIEPFAAAPVVRTIGAGSATAWRSGRLEYIGEPLKYVVTDINRYAQRPIRIADPQVGELLLTGTVFEDSIDVWLRSVEDLLPVTVRDEQPGEIVLERR